MKPASYIGMNTSSTSTVNRVAIGKFGAGRFDFKVNNEADIDLVDDEMYDDIIDEEQSDISIDAEKLSVHGKFTPEQAADLLDQFRSLARSKSYSSVDSDEVASEACAKYLEGIAKGWDVRDHRGLIVSLVSRTRARSTQNEHDHWNRKAMKQYHKQVEMEESFLHRPLTPSEKKTVADDVRTRWIDWERRPAENFHLQNTTYIPIDAVDENGYSRIENEVGLRASTSGSSIDFEGEMTRAALDTAEGVGADGSLPNKAPRGAKLSSAKFSWNALAEISDTKLPIITENSISKRQRTNMLAAVKESGLTVPEIASQWERGVRNSTTDALFMPFGEDVSESAKQNIADKLIEHPDYAEKLWNSAVTFVTRGH